MSTKSKSALPETPNAKVSPAAPPRVSKSARGAAKSETDSVSPLQHARLSVDRSPRSVPSKPTVDRRSPKLSNTPPDKKTTTRILKPSELQADLTLAQEDLKKAKEKLLLAEKEKEKVLDELKESRRSAEEASAKLGEALMAQKRAEENSEIEKFRAVEMEQAGIEAAHKKEEEWQKELETVRNQHALDVAALLSTTQELQRVKQELAMTCDAKNQALSHADDAAKIAEANAERVETLSAELVHLKSVLDSQIEMETNESNKHVTELKMEIDSLRLEVENAKFLEEKLAEKEAALEQLNVDLEATKMAESYARNLVDELHGRVEELTSHAEQAKRLERSASESLESVMKQLEGSNDSLHDAKSEIATLKEKVALLEISVRRQKVDLEESEQHLQVAKEAASEMAKKVEILRSELEAVKEEKAQSLNNEQLAAASVQALLEEKNKLINELETSRDEEEKSKKALESLASALHEISSEARDAKEKLMSCQVEQENYETQIEDLKLVLKATNEKYESMLDDAKHEINTLTNSFEQSKHEHERLKAEWEQKEIHLVDSLKKGADENTSMENEINRLFNLLQKAEEEVCAIRESEERWKKSCNDTESEVVYLKEVLGEAKAENMRLKENLMEHEEGMQKILQENEDMKKREESALNKVEELSKMMMLGEVSAKKENGELTDSEKDYDMLPKVVEFSEQNGAGQYEAREESSLPATGVESSFNDQAVEGASGVKSSDGKENDEGKSKDNFDSDLKMWESCKIEEKDFSPEGETEQEESFDDEVESKAEGDLANGQSSTENVDNGGGSPPSKTDSLKKKKPLFRKFGSLLKKKGTVNQK
ncbi:WEB family protein At5g16730, chloroplastic-like [Andrographis paniculata]|uniref:WEB family protein At5g16730, chloroplastic-like n=1 Tax=Andrographis paniculata TaxID=175694 RepID=UPI0021E7C4CD|nr:WEB family protein At5g16730, chloroplastic-like [Andrographis paniculata]